MTRGARRALWILVAAALAAPFPAFLSVPVPLPIIAALVGMTALSTWRTRDALLVLAGLGPLAGVIHLLSRAPYDPAALLEAFVLGVLCGAAVRAAVRAAPGPATAFEAALLVLAMLAGASCLALLPTAALRDGVDHWAGAVRNLYWRDYFFHPASFLVVERTVLLVEGCALAIVAGRVFRGREDAIRLSTMLVAGATGAAVLNLYRLVEVSVRQEQPLVSSLLSHLSTLRINTQYADLNAAGSYFALIAILAAGQAGFQSAKGRIHAVAVAFLGSALWMCGSRVALVSAFLGIAVVMLTRRYGYSITRRIPASALVVTGAAAVLLLAALVFLLPLTRHASFRYSLGTRVAMVETGLRMTADRPLLGIGVGQYYMRFPEYAPAELYQSFAQELGYEVERENAHNQFVQILAELGLAGLVAFLAALATGLRASRSSHPEREAAVIAVCSFLLTALAGHPLLTPMVAFPFWIVFGLAAAPVPAVKGSWRIVCRWATVCVAALMLAVVPWRWEVERQSADLTGVTVGFLGPAEQEQGRQYRIAAGPASLFVPREVAVVRLPLRSSDPFVRSVEIRLDGRLAGLVTVEPRRWTEARIVFPEVHGHPRFRRIDLLPRPATGAKGSSAAQLEVGRPIEIYR